jgi:hypothetical protein
MGVEAESDDTSVDDSATSEPIDNRLCPDPPDI